MKPSIDAAVPQADPAAITVVNVMSSPEEVFCKARAEASAKAVSDGLTEAHRTSAILEGMSMQVRKNS